MEHDIIMLKYEAYGTKLMDSKGLSYSDEHGITDQIFDYRLALTKRKESKS
ncbi:hypothetical protein N692_06400 [Lactiplantibacillus plantarum EGD-AQ4]|nr:hypothetical protein N692_06400 [Lactiplantibacillus plantarum EGD-AQ4]